MRSSLRPEIISLVATFALGACASNGSTNGETVETGPDSTEVDEERAAVLDTAVAAILDAVAARSGLETDALTVIEASEVDWADQRLGCVHFAQPAEPEPVDGFRVVVDADDVEFDYRVDDLGTYELCGDPIAATPEPHDDDGDTDLDESTE